MIRGPLAAGELAALAAVAPTALTFAVDRLAHAGYVERVRDPADRRRVLVKATDKALRFAEAVWGETVAESERQLAKYTRQQLELLTGFVGDQVELQRRLMPRIRAQAVHRP